MVHSYISNNIFFLQGDSGGGLVYNNMIYGLLVFGDPDYACKHPTVYMNICTGYLTWIHNTILHG